MSFKDPFANSLCECTEGPYPEWFKQYMKKFKKDLFKDLRSNISEIIHEEFEKEKKLAQAKLHKPLPDKNESSSGIKLIRKKKISDKDIDMFEKREMKLLKKFDKLCKFDGLMYPVVHLEKLEYKASPLVEKRQFMERGHQNKTRDAKQTLEFEKKYIKNGKFTLASESSVFLILQPGAEFSFTVNILNNGRVPWVSPCMECLSPPDIYIREQLINLPRLEPDQSVNVTIKGKATQSLGHYCFTYKLFDGVEGFGPLFSCFAVVSESKKKVTPNSEQLKLNNNATPSGNFLGTLINSENVTISSSQKKIKENIIEIKRTLQDIDLLRQCTSRDKSRKGRSNDNPEEFQVRGCDSMEDKDKKFWKERLEEELISTVDSFKEMGKTEKSEIVENENFQAEKNGAQSDSDSELSVILTSEEDENFIFVSLLPESSNSESLNNMKKPSKVDLRKESKEDNQKPKKGIVEECFEKVQPKEVGCRGISSGESLCYLPITENNKCTEETKSSFESIPIASYIKPSTGCIRRNTPPSLGKTYFPTCYTELNVESKGSPISYSAEEILLSRNLKTGEKRSHDQTFSSCISNRVFYNTHECCVLEGRKTHNTENEGRWPNFLPTYDCLGKPIYAVRYDGYCFPMKDLIQNEVRVLDVAGMLNSKQETQKELKPKTNVNHTATEDETKSTSQSGMINVASKAFETAKCVISNLQSAFKQEMENKVCDTEKHKPHEESVHNFPYDLYSMGEEERHYVEKLTNKEKYFDAMLALQEMGFLNIDLNFRLLKKHDCELLNVITEILDMPAGETVNVNSM